MNNVTIVLPVSREDNLKQIFHHLETLVCDRSRTSILTIVDGSNDLYVKTRNLTELSKFSERLCVQFKSQHKLRHFDVLGRRMRISDIHNFAKKHINNSEYVFGIEDDTIVPNTALKKLLMGYYYEPYAGFIQGVELGRWGIPYVGAWRADDVYNPTKIESLLEKDGLQPIDAGGFYCFLTKAETYVNHEFKPFDNNGLGPDVDYGMTLRREGVQNFVDWSVKCIHKSKDKEITFSNTTPSIVVFTKNENRWRQGQKK